MPNPAFQSASGKLWYFFGSWRGTLILFSQPAGNSCTFQSAGGEFWYSLVNQQGIVLFFWQLARNSGTFQTSSCSWRYTLVHFSQLAGSSGTFEPAGGKFWYIFGSQRRTLVHFAVNQPIFKSVYIFFPSRLLQQKINELVLSVKHLIFRKSNTLCTVHCTVYSFK